MENEAVASFFSYAVAWRFPMRKGETTRQRILEQAAPVFNQRGFAGCSMRDLMIATGLEKGGIYRHFASKQELATEAFRFALGLNVKIRTEPLTKIPGAVAKLRRAVQIFVEEPSPIAGGCPIMNTAIDADDGNPALRGLALEGIQLWRNRLCRIIDTGIRNGEILRGTQPRSVANTIIATLEGALMISRLERDRIALQDARQSLDALFDRIAAPGTSSTPQ
jgi:AcrR family transcriptional regulator